MALFTKEDVPPNWQSYIAKNREVFQSDWSRNPGG